MKTKLLLTLIIFSSYIFGQNIGIGTATPDASAMLDIVNANRGLLIPRVTLGATNSALPITSPATGLMVYNTATASSGVTLVTPGHYYWNGAQWVRYSIDGADWKTIGNLGTNSATNFIGTTDAVDFVVRTNNTEKLRVESGGDVGIGVANPIYKLEIEGTFGFGNGISGTYRSRTETRDNAGQMATQSGFFETVVPVNYPAGATSWWHLIDSRHSNNANNYALQIAGSFFDQDLYFRKTNNNGAQAWSKLLTSTSGWQTLGNAGTVANTNFIGTTDAIDFVIRTSNVERMRVTAGGNIGIGITIPTQKFDVQGGNARINTTFIGDVGHGAAWAGIASSSQASTTGYAMISSNDGNYTLINKQNTGVGHIGFRVGNNDYMTLNNNGNLNIYRSVLFDCNDCGSTTTYNNGAGNGNWGDLVIQGRVLSTNSNLHLSPPAGSRVIINSVYRAAGGGNGTTGLDVEDGGIRMRKNYRWINRYGSTGGFGWGSQTHNLGAWDYCAVGHVGFRNTNSNVDEDDDVQCAVYPNAHADPGEGSLWDSFFTYQYNQRPNWFMYLEGYADTNATNCAASCINFD